MQRLEVSGAVRLICRSLGVKGLRSQAYIGFRVSAEMCILDSAEGLSRADAKNTRDTYVSTNVRSQ